MCRNTGGWNLGSVGFGGGSRARISAREDVQEDDGCCSDLTAFRMNHGSFVVAGARGAGGVGVGTIEGGALVPLRFSDLYQLEISAEDEG